MDGVIVDSEPVHQQLEREMYASLGLTISEEEHKSYVGTSAVDMWTMISKKRHLAKSPEELLLIGRMQYWAALDNDEVPLVHGVKSIITTFHELGYTLQVASSATRPTVDKVMAHFQLDMYFSHRIGGNEVTKSKPDPEIFLRAAQQSGSAADRCLVIEDSTNGLKAALQAGMFCIGYANSGTGEQDLSAADLVVNDLLSITPEIIAKIH